MWNALAYLATTMATKKSFKALVPGLVGALSRWAAVSRNPTLSPLYLHLWRTGHRRRPCDSRRRSWRRKRPSERYPEKVGQYNKTASLVRLPARNAIWVVKEDGLSWTERSKRGEGETTLPAISVSFCGETSHLTHAGKWRNIKTVIWAGLAGRQLRRWRLP